MYSNIFIAFIILIIIILLWLSNNHIKNYENGIYGLWVSSDVYNKDAEITSMRLFIGEPKYHMFSITRNARLQIDNDITDQDVEINYNKTWITTPNINSYKLYAKITMSDNNIWDDHISMDFDFMKNKLSIYNGSELLGVLYKDNEITESLLYLNKQNKEADQEETDDNINNNSITE